MKKYNKRPPWLLLLLGSALVGAFAAFIVRNIQNEHIKNFLTAFITLGINFYFLNRFYKKQKNEGKSKDE